ncbi:MAG TPA: STAS domain-containing protein [Acidimicrobiales bacterium]|jgi:anti-sigma B factor antagonist|nr:STAS domain-containing protein [Acidimicrobiales bacterium]HEX2192949.1 STAS domain-containing protein [Acidimicrobiales bacterium]
MATVEAFDEFGLEVSSSGGPDLVLVTGEVDCYTAPTLQQRLFELVDGGSRHIVVDLAEVSFMDSQGLAALVRTAVRLRPLEGQLTLRSPRPSVCKILEITGLGGVLPAS